MSGITFEVKTPEEVASLISNFRERLKEFLYYNWNMYCHCSFYHEHAYGLYGSKLYLKIFLRSEDEHGLIYDEKLTVSYDSWGPLTTGIDEEVEKIAFLLLFEGGAS
jgi:hypothetical protein